MKSASKRLPRRRMPLPSMLFSRSCTPWKRSQDTRGCDGQGGEGACERVRSGSAPTHERGCSGSEPYLCLAKLPLQELRLGLLHVHGVDVCARRFGLFREDESVCVAAALRAARGEGGDREGRYS